MKKILVVLLLLIIVPVIVIAGITAEEKSIDYLRLHIRANSNSESDQAVKYLVKAAVVDLLEEKVSVCAGKEEVENVINSNLKNIEDVADKILLTNGKTYRASAQIKSEYFPTRSYDDLVLDAGWYDALIINLGTGKGDNWWCVVYPPLCFVGATNNGSDNIRYKSVIREFFDNILQ